MSSERFPLPDEIELPEEAKGWEDLYPYHGLFSRTKGDYERFWFLDNLHFPLPMTPFESDILVQYHPAPIGSFQSRVWPIPAALGPYYRVLGGYIYISSQAINDPVEIQRRVEMFRKRAGHYFQNWVEILEQWRGKTRGLIEDLKKIEFKELPEFEPEESVFQRRGVTASYDLIAEYDKLMLLWEKSWYYHFEMFLAYGSALAFMDVTKKLFPGMSDRTVFAMIAGIKSPLWEPDEKLKELAKLALKLNVADVLKQKMEPDQLFEQLSKRENGQTWLQELEKRKDPWFYVGTAQHPGLYNPKRTPSWIHDLSVPLNFIAGYVERLERGENIDRDLESITKERDRLIEEYLGLLSDEQDRKAFRDALELARLAWPYTEEHNWWYDNLAWTITWTKALGLGKVLARYKVIDAPEDIFYLKVEEVRLTLHDLAMSWAEGLPPSGSDYWPEIIGKRKKIVRTLEAWRPPRALGKPPEVIVEPITIMLWGITTDRVKVWMKGLGKPEEVFEVRGLPGSPGLVEGPARLVRKVDELGQLKMGDIMVSPFTSPMWSPAFGTAKAVVTDIGGLMSHTAIVCREYGIPAVVGTGMATDVIKTGDVIKVDGNEGVVRIVKRAG